MARQAQGRLETVPPTQPQFAAQSVPLGQLFADPLLLEAPAYQRSYAWASQEAGRLLEDISAALEAGEEAGESDYFLGTMLLLDRDRSGLRHDGWPLAGAARAFEVVDGLQRLTTLTILFCVLRDFDQDDNEPPSERLLAAIGSAPGANGGFRLALREKDEQFFLAHVRGPGACLVMPENDQQASSESRILEVREHFLTALMDLDAAQRRRLADFLLQRCYIVLIATTGIDRAHRMFMVLNDTGKPLARNDILKAELLGRVPAASAVAVTSTWEALEGRLQDDFESLFSHIRAMHGRPGGHVIAGIRAIIEESGGAEGFITRVLQPAAAVFHDIRDARHAGASQSAAITHALTYLRRLPATDWVPAAMAWWLDKGKDPSELAWFLSALDRLAHGVRILGLGAGRRTQRFGAIIWAIRNGQDLKGGTGPLVFSREELRNIQYNLRDLHARSAPTAKLVLVRLNDQIARAPQVLPISELTVEHVLPRKHGTSSQWRTWFPDPEVREQCTEFLGNLVLVTKAQNDKAGNLDFARKHAVYFDTPGVPAPAINEGLRGKSEWKAEQIREREAFLLRQLDTLWNLGSPVAAPDGGDGKPKRRRRGRGG